MHPVAAIRQELGDRQHYAVQRPPPTLTPRTAMTSQSNINEIRQAIYAATGVAGFSRGYRSRKLRKVCPMAQGLDLRRKSDAVFLAEQLGLIKSDAPQVGALESLFNQADSIMASPLYA